MKKIYIYVHICCIGDWEKVFTKIIYHIKNSGLYDIINNIRCVILGKLKKLPDIFNDKKIKILKQCEDKSLYERATLREIYNDSINSDKKFYALYLHTKGITHTGYRKEKVDAWFDYLLYFNCYKFKKILKLLKNYDVVGVNLRKTEGKAYYKREILELKEKKKKEIAKMKKYISKVKKKEKMNKPIVTNTSTYSVWSGSNLKTYYSGNIWWSNSDYIKTLTKQIGKNYTDPEFWVTSKNKIDNKKIYFLSLWNSNVNHYHTLYGKKKYFNKKYFKLYTNWDLIESNME